MDRWCPPPVNTSNLNDISNALQAVNITQQERTALDAQANDTLGQILNILKSGINTAQSELQTKGNCLVQTGSYVGNGQVKTMSITFDFEPDTVFIVSSNINTIATREQIQCLFTTYSYAIWNKYITSYQTYFRSAYLGYATLDFTLSEKQLSYSAVPHAGSNGSPTISPEMCFNYTGATYQWIAFKQLV